MFLLDHRDLKTHYRIFIVGIRLKRENWRKRWTIKACEGSLSQSPVLHQCPALFASLKKYREPQRRWPSLSHVVIQSREHTHTRVHVVLSSSLGKNAPSLWSLLCLVHRSHKNGIPIYLPANATSSRRASVQGDRWGQRYFCSIGGRAGFPLETAGITVCVLFWPLNVIALGQVLKAARIFNQISYFFPKFPWKGFTRLLLISKGGVNSSLQSAIPLALAGAIWCCIANSKP